MKFLLNILLLILSVCSLSKLQAQEDKTKEYAELKAQADKKFFGGDYELAKTLYDSCRRTTNHEFDDYLIEQIESSNRCLGYRRAIDEICKDANLWKACLGLYEKIIDINPKDSIAKQAIVQTYWQAGKSEFEKWDFPKAKTFFNKVTSYANPLLTTDARAYLDSCNYYIERLETGFNTAEVDSVATFVNGLKGINKIIENNMSYPTQAAEKKIGGKVWVGFVVNEKGRIIPETVKILKSVGGGCDEEAMRLIKMMNPWNPAFLKGRPVRTQLTYPIQFTIK